MHNQSGYKKQTKIMGGGNLLKIVQNLLYILTSVWLLRTPNAGQNGHFQRFLCKKPKKARNLQQILAKKQFF